MDDCIVDACCLINVCAAGNVRSRLVTLGGAWYVPKAVLSETAYLRVERDDGSIDKEPIDWDGLVVGNLLSVCEPAGKHELDLYVELAAQLDDGEAMALAIAQARQWVLSTDDRKALRIAEQRGVGVITTPEIMKRWADLSPDREALSTCLKRIERRASFSPAAKHPLYSWWRGSVLG